MDFTKLEGMVIAPDNLTPQNEQLRCSLYIEFANTRSLQKLYSHILTSFKEYIHENLLPANYEQDILYAFFNENKHESTMKKIDNVDVKMYVYSLPLFPIINIAPSLKRSHQVIAGMDKIGYQHLYMLSHMTDTSESSNNDNSDSDIGEADSAPLKKRLKTCQRAIEANCNSMLKYHDKNLTHIAGTTVHVDILIFINKSVCKQLSRYLGLIYVEDLLPEAGEDDMDNVLRRLNNKSAKLYRLVQSYINKKLIGGCNNICLVHTLPLWENINASVRGVISNTNDKLFYAEPIETANFHVELGKNPVILNYIEAISSIIDNALGFNSHVIAKYQSAKDSYYNIKLPVTSIVPLYVLKYFTQCEIRKQKREI